MIWRECEIFIVKKILVPTDGSKYSLQAAQYAAEFAKRFDAIVQLLNVIPLPSYDVELTTMPLPYDFTYSWQVDQAKKYLQETKEVFDKLEVSVITHPPIRGHPADVICEVVEEEKFDLIIMGSRGLSTTEKYRLGGVTDKVIQHATCPVLIVR